MPTVEELEIAYRDQVSAGAKAATDSLNKMADAMDRAGASAETTDTKITRTTRSSAGYVNSFDNVTKSAKALERAQADLQAAQDKLSASVAAGDIDAQAAARTLQTLQQRVADATEKHKKFADASNETNDALKLSRQQWSFVVDDINKFVDQIVAGGSATKAAFYQLPQIATNMGGFGNATRIVTGFLTGPAGLAAGALGVGAALAAMGVYAEHQQEQLAQLSTQLRATRDDYQGMAAAAIAASKQAAATGSISLSDAKSTTGKLAAVPTVGASDLLGLTKQAQDLAAVLGKSVPEAAQAMVDAMRDPEKAAEQFAQSGLLGVNEQLAQQVKALQDSGDKLGAYKMLQDQVTAAVSGAAKQSLTDYQKAVEGLSAAWYGASAGSKSFTESIGGSVMSAVAASINTVTESVKDLNDAFSKLSLKSAGKSYLDYLQYATPLGPLAGLAKSLIPSDGASGAASIAASGQSVSQIIDSVGQQLGASADVVSLAHRIQPIESSTGQYGANGHVVMSSAGAVGAMQVMPSNANGNDIYTTTGNVTAAEQYLIGLYQKYSGNEALVAMAYNWGPGNVDKWLSHDISSVPQSVQDYAQKVTGGNVYSATTVAAKQGTVDDALRTSDGSTAASIQAEQRAITQLTTAQSALNDLHDAGKVSDSDYASETENLTQRLGKHRGALLDLRDPMQQLAYQQGLAIQSSATYSAAEQAMIEVDQQVEQAARKMGQAHASASDILAAEARQQAILINQFNSSIDAIDRQTDAQKKLVAGYDGATGTLASYENAEKAAEQARATAVPGTTEYARQVGILTSALNANAAAAADVATAQQLYSQHLDLDYIKAETSLVGQNSDAVSVQLAVLKARNDLLAKGADVTDQTSQAYLSNVAAIQQATNAYQHQQQVLSDLTSSLSSIADTLTDDISQAFVSGSGSAVNFSNVLKAMESQLVGLAAKFVIINPLLNSFDGGTRTTIGDVSSLLGSSSSSQWADGSTATTSVSQMIGTGNYLNIPTASTSSSVSLLGQIGSLPGAILAGGQVKGLGSVGSWLNTSEYGSGKDAVTNANIIGGALYGANAIYDFAKGGTSNVISGVGSTAATALSFIPGAQVFAPIAAIGGSLLGSLFKSHPKNPYTIDNVNVDSSGQLSLGQSWNQAQSDTLTAQTQSDIAAVNAVLSSTGAAIYTGGGVSSIGSVRSDPNNKNSALQNVTLSSLLSNAGYYSSTDSTFNTALATGLPSTYDSVDAFTTAITSLKTMADTVDDLGVHVSKFNETAQTVDVTNIDTSKYSTNAATAIQNTIDGKTMSVSDLQSAISAAVTFADTTYPQLLEQTTSSSQSFADQIASMQDTYYSAEQSAASYGLSVSALQDKLDQLTQDMWHTAAVELTQSSQSLNARYLSATGDQEGADLENYDVSAAQERTSLDQQWQSIYGSGYASMTSYWHAVAELEQTEAAERLKIQTTYQDQATEASQDYWHTIAQQQVDAAAAQAQKVASAQSTVGNLIDGISSYASSLLLDDSSPLTAAQKYQAANSNWTTDLARAQAGDLTAAGSLTTDASAFLAQSRSYYGSNAQATTDYQAVLDGLRSIVGLGSDALTASALNAATETQTATLGGKLDQANTLLARLLTEAKQAAQRAA